MCHPWFSGKTQPLCFVSSSSVPRHGPRQLGQRHRGPHAATGPPVARAVRSVRSCSCSAASLNPANSVQSDTRFWQKFGRLRRRHWRTGLQALRPKSGRQPLLDIRKGRPAFRHCFATRLRFVNDGHFLEVRAGNPTYTRDRKRVLNLTHIDNKGLVGFVSQNGIFP